MLSNLNNRIYPSKNAYNHTVTMLGAYNGVYETGINHKNWYAQNET